MKTVKMPGARVPAYYGPMLTPQTQRTFVTVLAVLLGITLVLSLVGPFLN